MMIFEQHTQLTNVTFCVAWLTLCVSSTSCEVVLYVLNLVFLNLVSAELKMVRQQRYAARSQAADETMPASQPYALKAGRSRVIVAVLMSHQATSSIALTTPVICSRYM